jgi:predicted nucleic acid-binding protein
VTVIDASVWIGGLIVEDIHHAVSRRWLDQYLASDGPIIEPTLLLPEVAGAVARRTGIPALARRAIRQLLLVRAIDLVAMDPSLGLASARLAANLGLRGADAVYVATAQRRNVPLVTWDNEQLTRTGDVIVTRSP